MDCPYIEEDKTCGAHALCKKCIEDILLRRWGEDFIKVIQRAEPLNMACHEFFNECIACGGNWSASWLSGVKRLRHEVWDAIPENMGENSWESIMLLLTYLGVKTWDD